MSSNTPFPPPHPPHQPPPPQFPPQGGVPQHVPGPQPPAPAPGAYPALHHPYGQPPQAPYPGPVYGGPPPGAAPPPPGGHRRGGRSPVVAVIAVVLVLALAGGAWFLLGSDEDDSAGGRVSAVDPSTPGGRMWSVDEDVPDEGTRPTGFWAVNDTIVKANGSVLTAYAMADGSEVWTLELEGDAICVPSTATPEGLLVVGHGEHNCGQNITQIDLTTGETGWSRPLEPEEDPLGFQIAMAGSSYAIHTLGGWNLHRVADGEEISSAGAGYDALSNDARQTVFGQEAPELVTGEDVCAVDAVAGGAALIRLRTCAIVLDAAAGTLGDPIFRLEEIDPDTGDTMWTLDLPEGRWLEKIHSSSPLVVSLTSEEFGPVTELMFVEAGQITGQVPIETTGVPAADAGLFAGEACRDEGIPYSAVDDCGGLAVHGDLLYISPETGIGGGTTVTAMNATTGEVVWSHRTEDFFRQMVLAADEEGAIVHQVGFDGELGQVVRITDGRRVEPLFKVDDVFLTPDSFMAFNEGRLFFSPTDYSLEYDIAAYGPDGEVTTSPSASTEPAP
ncbi:outer membrane protein assembly factor BamB family protein [Streptomyces litchfieldiae]|uniref:PQQ-binding-like beta-propeller repeat protein n=1 Tax=Streptomyces litchfieldiae TaxID=3075543 RepID=A0ABU2MUZ5_9ACTN|nr:PQQ-binding-like beta-propeller repeat protein [Streptomyces sp. DSM 44938]MDT0345468.1 PQQ-binding-like beta-propeller repeat protein [Streptomyces sp. DSM 44938]